MPAQYHNYNTMRKLSVSIPIHFNGSCSDGACSSGITPLHIGIAALCVMDIQWTLKNILFRLSCNIRVHITILRVYITSLLYY